MYPWEELGPTGTWNSRVTLYTLPYEALGVDRAYIETAMGAKVALSAPPGKVLGVGRAPTLTASTETYSFRFSPYDPSQR